MPKLIIPNEQEFCKQVLQDDSINSVEEWIDDTIENLDDVCNTLDKIFNGSNHSGEREQFIFDDLIRFLRSIEVERK